jgi:hypothetical protein
MNDCRRPHRPEGTDLRPEDVRHESTMASEKATYERAELLAMAEAADAPLDVLRALRELAPQARFRYLAELWTPRPEVRRR